MEGIPTEFSVDDLALLKSDAFIVVEGSGLWKLSKGEDRPRKVPGLPADAWFSHICVGEDNLVAWGLGTYVVNSKSGVAVAVPRPGVASENIKDGHLWPRCVTYFAGKYLISSEDGLWSFDRAR